MFKFIAGLIDEPSRLLVQGSKLRRLCTVYVCMYVYIHIYIYIYT